MDSLLVIRSYICYRKHMRLPARLTHIERSAAVKRARSGGGRERETVFEGRKAVVKLFGRGER